MLKLMPMLADFSEISLNTHHTIAAIEEEDTILFYREQRDFNNDTQVVLGPFLTLEQAMFGINPI